MSHRSSVVARFFCVTHCVTQKKSVHTTVASTVAFVRTKSTFRQQQPLGPCSGANLENFPHLGHLEDHPTENRFFQFPFTSSRPCSSTAMVTSTSLPLEQSLSPPITCFICLTGLSYSTPLCIFPQILHYTQAGRQRRIGIARWAVTFCGGSGGSRSQFHRFLGNADVE